MCTTKPGKDWWAESGLAEAWIAERMEKRCVSPRPRPSVRRLVGRRLADQDIAKHQRVHLCPQKTVQGLFGAAHDGLVVVERRVQHHRHAGEVGKLTDQPPVARVRGAPDRLEPPGAVHMSWR